MCGFVTRDIQKFHLASWNFQFFLISCQFDSKEKVLQTNKNFFDDCYHAIVVGLCGKDGLWVRAFSFRGTKILVSAFRMATMWDLFLENLTIQRKFSMILLGFLEHSGLYVRWNIYIRRKKELNVHQLAALNLLYSFFLPVVRKSGSCRSTKQVSRNMRSAMTQIHCSSIFHISFFDLH